MFEIPEDDLPECLKEEQRINVLFAPLRSRSANSKDWDNKISSWKTIIKAYCNTNDVYKFSLSSLNNIFVRNGRPPSCLREVIQDMIDKSEVQIADVFFRKTSDSWSGWASDILLKRPLSWSLDKVNSLLPSRNSDPVCVHLETVKKKCEQLTNRIPKKSLNKLISLKDLLEILGNNVNEENVRLLLHYLENERKVDIRKLNDKEESDKFLIKFGNSQNVTRISQIDIAIYTLEKNEQIISENMESLEDEIQECVTEAKTHLSKSHRQLAKSALRKKHELEKRLDKKAKALHTVQTLLEQIHETHSDAHVWESYKKALFAFNTTLKDTGLSEDAIDDTMIQLGEMLEKHNDMQAALATPIGDLETDTSLEEELNELLRDEVNHPPPDNGLDTSNLEELIDKLTIDLPQVPDTSPNISQIIELDDR